MAVKKPKRKNAAAVALSKRQLEVCPPEERSARARSAVQARWKKARGEEATTYWGLFSISTRPGKALDKSDLDHPQLLFASKDRNAVIEYDRNHPGGAYIAPFDGPPPAFTVKRSFKPDLAKQTKALLAVLGEGDVQ
jgi:hypothetical protein